MKNVQDMSLDQKLMELQHVHVQLFEEKSSFKSLL